MIHSRSGREVKFALLLARRAGLSLRKDAIASRGDAYWESFTASEEQ